jgi:hypothetical protein
MNIRRIVIGSVVCAMPCLTVAWVAQAQQPAAAPGPMRKRPK